MYNSFIDIWEGSSMWGQHIEDWKTPEEQNDDSVKLDCGSRLYGGGNDDGSRRYD